ncbi:MAG: tail fiber domain-containing protein, partial [Paludibacteraceae bacterium]|nr:tail fiber domain-containing protein [Paludibacteraceae bacterium]
MNAKILLLSALLTVCFFSMQVGAQIKVINTGKVGVAGAFTALSISTYTNPFSLRGSSDADNDIPDKILSLRPFQYQLGDTTMDDGLTHYGLDAQVMKRLFPDLVQEDKAGCISINYVELIPLLVQTVQELSAEVEELKSTNRQNVPSYKSGMPDNKQAALFQNTPNPFSQNT